MARRSFDVIRAVAVLMAMLLCCLLPCNAFAAEVTADIFDLESTANMAVVIGYEGAVPSVTFIRPNGRELGEDDLIVIKGSGTMTYRIPDASRGQWQIRYDKTGSQKIDISWAPYAEELDIASLRFDRIAIGSAEETDVHFTVNSVDEDRYSYVIYAAIADENGNVTGTKRLADGKASPNEECTKTVRLKDIQMMVNQVELQECHCLLY